MTRDSLLTSSTTDQRKMKSISMAWGHGRDTVGTERDVRPREESLLARESVPYRSVDTAVLCCLRTTDDGLHGLRLYSIS